MCCGGGSPPPPQQTTTTVTNELSPEQRQLLNLAMPVAERFVQNPPTFFPGPTVAPFSPLETEGQQAALAFAREQLPGIVGAPTQGLQFLTSGDVLRPESNPALQAAIEAAIRPLHQTFGQQILPGIRGEAQLAGQFGGSRQGVAEGIASQALLQGVGDVSARMQSEAYQTALDNMTRALAFAPGIVGLGLLPSDVISAVGGQQRGMEQALINEQIQRHAAEQLLPFQAAQQVAGLAFGMPGGGTTSTSLIPGTQQPSALQRGLGGAAAGAALGSMLGFPGIGGVVGGLAGWLFG